MAATDALVFVSGRVDSLTEGWLEEMVGWVTCHPGVGFSSGLILDAAGNVVEAGLVLDREGHGSPLFRGIPPHQWGWFGGPLWYRNTSAVSPWLAAISAESYLSAGGFDEHLPWQRSFPALCRAIGSSGKRGLVDPHARATLTAGELPAVPAFDESLKHDLYFHPAFSSVVPLELGKNSQASATSGAPACGRTGADRQPPFPLARLGSSGRSASRMKNQIPSIHPSKKSWQSGSEGYARDE